MASPQDVTVQIFDRTYRIRSEMHEQDYVRRAAAYLDGKMRTAAQSATQRSQLDIAILAAMEIADEILAQRRRKKAMLAEVDSRINAFTERLEKRRFP